MKREYTVVYEPVENGWFMVTSPELSGAISQGRTLDEARYMIKDAIQLLLECYRDDVAKLQASGAIVETVIVEIPNLASHSKEAADGTEYD